MATGPLGLESVGAPLLMTNGTVDGVALPAGSLTVTVGLPPMLVPVPVQVTVLVAGVAGAGDGVQVAPGIVTVSPALMPGQLIVTVCVLEAGFGLAVQLAALGAVVSMVYGTTAVVGLPAGSVAVTVGFAATELGEVDVHTTLPPVDGLGLQVVPAMVMVSPAVGLAQVMTVLTV